MTNAEKYLKDNIKENDFANMCVDLARYFDNKTSMQKVADFFNEQAKPTLTEDERVILRSLHEEYIHIRRNKMGNLYVGVDYFGMYDNLFPFIKNGEEYSIEELLKGE